MTPPQLWPSVFSRLVEELEKPRLLTPQVLRYLSATYGVGRDEVGPFLDQRLSALDETETDLTLSSLFTPKLSDQARFAELLGDALIPERDWSELVRQLDQRPTQGCLVTEEGAAHRFPLATVTLERYVHRLRLDGTVSEPLYRLIQTLPPAEDRPLLLAIARRSIWDTPERQQILFDFLAKGCTSDGYRRDDAEALLTLMETAEPSSVEDILQRLPEWEGNLRTQLASTSLPRPFFNSKVEELHGGGRDHRASNEEAAAHKRAELEFLGRLARAMA